MPTPQSFLASKTQGFVCRSCLAKFRASRNSRPIWPVRAFASDDHAPPRVAELKSKNSSHVGPKIEHKPVIRMFDQGPDGARREVQLGPEEPQDEALFKSLQSRIEGVEEEVEGSEEEPADEEIHHRAIEKEIEGMLGGEEFEEYIVSQVEKLEEEIDKEMERVAVENLSLEEYQQERMKISRRLLETRKMTGAFLSDSGSDSTELGTSTRPQAFLIDILKFAEISDQLRLGYFNRFLREAAGKIDEGYSSKMARTAWHLYNSCRDILLSQPENVPNEAWELLWGVFTGPDNISYRFVTVLGADMIGVGLPLPRAQYLFYIRAIFTNKQRDKAIELWESIEIGPEDDVDFVSAYWQLGVFIYSHTHKLDKALQAVEFLGQIKNDPQTSRLLIPLIETFLSSTEDNKEQKAWALYVRLRLALGSRIEMKDYDDVVAAFFAASAHSLALGVFKDMMLTGHESASRYDSVARYRNGPGVKNDTGLMKIGEQGHVWDTPEVLSQLPSEFNNKFFFGKWLKKLIAEEQYDFSMAVFNLMHERGIIADPRYLNGLIGAWLRSGKAKNHRLAEETAWRMIRQRTEFVQNRDTAAKFTFPLRAIIVDDKPSHKGIWKHPNATIETFALLIQDYRRRQRPDRMKDLLAALQKAKIPPNTFFMNQMIMIQSEVQQYWSWDMYSTFTTTYQVRPDLHTFDFLWWLAKKAVDPSFRRNREGRVLSSQIDNAAVPRTMFAEMMKWATELNKGVMTEETYDTIILTFSLAQDHAGLAVALRALQRHFDIYPNAKTIRTIVLHLARASIEGEKGRTPRRMRVKQAPVQMKVAKIATLLESLKAERIESLLKQGIVFEDLTGNEKLEEPLLLMIQLLRRLNEYRLAGEKNVAQISEVAALQMGVRYCAPWID